MGEQIEVVDGIAFVLPKYESIGAVRRVGPLAVFINVAWDRFGVGIQLLEAGALLQIGPAYIGACHIARQQAAYDRLNRLTPHSTGGR